jgi:adenine-specific DNA-methyltransferase
MARRKKTAPKAEKTSGRKPIEQYEHSDKKRKNNPPVGLVTPQTDRESGKKTYAYDPHLDPQLVWAGKAEHTSFEVPTVSLHVHERIAPRTIIEAVRRKNGAPVQTSLFELPSENLPLRDAIDFYKHEHNWSNRLIAGDSLLVMNSLIEKEGLAGQVQMVYIDPPYGIRYGSNFQPFVNKRDVKDGKDEDLTQIPEEIRAFRDTWELGIHSYLTYLRDRLLLARELLDEAGSCFMQISDENLHHVRELMDEVFGPENFVSLIPFTKTTAATSILLPAVCDHLLWYGKEHSRVKFRQLFVEKSPGGEGASRYTNAELPDGTRRRLRPEEQEDLNQLPTGARLYSTTDLKSQGFRQFTTVSFKFEGKEYHPGPDMNWKTTVEGLQRLAGKRRIAVEGSSLRYVRYLDDFPVNPLSNVWTDVGGIQSRTDPKIYVVQTTNKVIARCILMTTDPGDLVFDPSCGSGTTAYVAEQWGRRWITCDTSRVAITLAKQRLMTALFDYYELAHPHEGVSSGFNYKKVPHVTLKSIANNEPPAQETLYDQPLVDKSRARVTGPFTVEAVPSPAVKLLTEVETGPQAADVSIARSGPTLRHTEWRDELLKCGIRGKHGQHILFSRVEPLAGTRWLHAEAETKPNDLGADSVREGEPKYGKPERVVISIGPEHSPLEQRQVELAWEEARQLSPKPTMLIFAAFQFDPEAAKDIDELTPEKTEMTFLKVQMNTDLLTEDLKKKRASNESFWLIGQPDVELRRITKDEHKGRYEVEVRGFDYYNTKTGAIESGGTDKIAVWLLDPDYDGRSLYPRQVFFPMAGDDEGWARLARNLKAEIDGTLIETYRGTVSLPFEPGKYKRIAVKIVDDRGIESLRIVEIS